MKIIKVCEKCVRACVNGSEMGFDPEDCRDPAHWILKQRYDRLNPHQQAVYRKSSQQHPSYSMWQPPTSQSSGQVAADGAAGAIPSSGAPKAIPKLSRGSAVIAFGSQVGLGASCKLPSTGASSVIPTLSATSAASLDASAVLGFPNGALKLGGLYGCPSNPASVAMPFNGVVA